MTTRTLTIAIGGVALAAVLAVGARDLGRRDGSPEAPATRLTPARTQALLTDAPAPLAALHAQGNLLLDGGTTALRARLAALRGWPQVIDKWASWCTSCRAERTIFQQTAAEEGRRVAFLGIDSGDGSRGEGQAFLRAAPVSYPSYWDPSGKVGEEATDSKFTPVTVFYTAGGSRFIHQGPYRSVAELERDVKRYALHA